MKLTANQTIYYERTGEKGKFITYEPGHDDYCVVALINHNGHTYVTKVKVKDVSVIKERAY